MGEIFNAFEVLNRTMKLGLNSSDLMRAEMGFKSALAQRGNPGVRSLAANPVALAESYELVATLRPRAEPVSLDQLATFAHKEMAKPRTRVDARTFKQVDKALGAVATRSGPAASKSGAAAKKSVTAAKKSGPAAKKSGPAAKKRGA